MSTWKTNGGGWNKSHGTVEETPRVDSFEAGAMEGGGALFVYGDDKTLLLDCDHYTVYGTAKVPDREIVELWAGEWSQTIELSRIASGFGGSRAYWLCPACGARVRFLYFTGAIFLCRRCSRVNYRSQQENKSDSMRFYNKGMALVEKHLDRWPRFRPDGFSFCDWVPDRPKGMHETTYRRYLARFLRYRKKHADRQMADMLRLLRMFK